METTVFGLPLWLVALIGVGALLSLILTIVLLRMKPRPKTPAERTYPPGERIVYKCSVEGYCTPANGRSGKCTKCGKEVQRY